MGKKDITPSNELRKWYGHDPEKWKEFSKDYRAELKDKPDSRQRVCGLGFL